MPNRLGPQKGVALAVAIALGLVGTNATVEFIPLENRLSSTWSALRGVDASIVDPESYEWGRYGLFLTLAEVGNGAEIVLPEKFGGNLIGRLLGIARLSSWRVVAFDEQRVVDAALSASGETFRGPASDGEAEFTIVRADADVSSLVFARSEDGDLFVIDLRLLPTDLAEEIVR